MPLLTSPSETSNCETGYPGCIPQQAATDRNNNFNLLRLVFAVCVILSHSPLLVDGDDHREVFKSLFGTVTLGEIAVDGFFLLSGFLIVKSWLQEPRLFTFLKKRILRVYPGFVAASLVCAYIVGPIGAYHPTRYFSELGTRHFLSGVCWLNMPAIPDAFIRRPISTNALHPILHAVPSVYLINASMWTISYEFRCYLLVAVFGSLGGFKRKEIWLAIGAVAAISTLLPDLVHRLLPIDPYNDWIGDPPSTLRLTAFFCTGGCFYLFRNRIEYSTKLAVAAGITLVPCMFVWRLAHLALPLLGGYLLFWFAFNRFRILDSAKKWPDISYGVYLYAFPIQQLICWYLPAISVWLLFIAATAISCGCGYLSLRIVEGPFQKLRGRRHS